MAIMRHAPGEPAPFPGTYRLVGHYGEVTTFSAWRERGQPLPTFTDDDSQFGPYWFVLVDEAQENTRAA